MDQPGDQTPALVTAFHNDQTSHAEKKLQAQAFAEICLALLSAGYFRARIATLSQFDKVRILGMHALRTFPLPIHRDFNLFPCRRSADFAGVSHRAVCR